MKSITQTRFLATNYSSLQGLKSVPFGLALLLLSLWANSLQGVPKDFTIPTVFFLGIVLLVVMIEQYYKRFGEVKPTITARRIEWVASIIGVVLAIGAFWVNVSFELPFTPIGLVFAAVFLVDDPKAIFPFNKFFIIKLIFSTCLVMLSISPLYWGVDWWSALGIKSALLGITVLFSMLMVARGLIWHLYFVHSLPIAEAKNE